MSCAPQGEQEVPENARAPGRFPPAPVGLGRLEGLMRLDGRNAVMDKNEMEWTGLVLGALALALGGVLKGATGAGSPLFAVPLLAMLYDVPLAVAIFTLPSLFSNIDRKSTRLNSSH